MMKSIFGNFAVCRTTHNIKTAERKRKNTPRNSLNRSENRSKVEEERVKCTENFDIYGKNL
jgi:hypothetical protein